MDDEPGKMLDFDKVRAVKPDEKQSHLCPFCLMSLHEHSGKNNFLCKKVRENRDGWVYTLHLNVCLYVVKYPKHVPIPKRFATRRYCRCEFSCDEEVLFIHQRDEEQFLQDWKQKGAIASRQFLQKVTIRACTFISDTFAKNKWKVKQTNKFNNFYGEHKKKGWYIVELSPNGRCGWCDAHQAEIEHDAKNAQKGSKKKKHKMSSNSTDENKPEQALKRTCYRHATMSTPSSSNAVDDYSTGIRIQSF